MAINQIEIDEQYVSSTAYHEAGHTVVAAAQGMPMRNLGVHMDSLGCGKAFYWRRVPDGSRNNGGSDVERERTAIATSAGFIAQKRFYSNASDKVLRYMELCAQSDTALVIDLLEEMYSGDRITWFAARANLFAESVRQVDKHWNVIDSLAKSLLAREWEPHRAETDADGEWSGDNREKWLHGIEVVAMLKPLGVPAFIVDDSVRTYSPTLKPASSNNRGRCPFGGWTVYRSQLNGDAGPYLRPCFYVLVSDP